MKKKMVIAICGLLVLVAGFLIVDNTIIEYKTINADRYELANDVNELEEASDVIVDATILSGKENRLNVLDDGIVRFGYTLTKIQINDVYKGDINVGDILNITEEYYVVDDGIGKTVFTQGAYEPAKEGKKYTLFLKKYEDTVEYEGMYFPIDLEKGKYVINDKKKDISIDKLTNNELEIITSDNNEAMEYKEWYKKVREKYTK